MNLPYLPIWIGDYLKETRHLSTEEHGAYLLLLFQYWTRQEAFPMMTRNWPASSA